MKNCDIRSEIVGAGLRYYQIADIMGFTPNGFSHLLAKDLSKRQKAQIKNAILAAQYHHEAGINYEKIKKQTD